MPPAPPRRRGPALAPHASPPERSRGRRHPEPEAAERSPHQRDRDRVLHSGAFRKLKYKTQVFVYHEGDYYRTRLTHSLEVAQLARSACRSLALNEDLAEALALAHDFGHTPFGHAGEEALDAAMRPWGGFDHNDQTLRVLTRLERRYAAFDGLNPTWETLEGLAKHNGPPRLPPSPTLADLDGALDLRLGAQAGPEAQVAAIADDIAYDAHDLDDGLRAGLFGIGELAEVPLVAPIVASVRAAHGSLEDGRLFHETARRLIDALVTDMLAETRRRLAALDPGSADDIRDAPEPVAAFSEETREKDAELKAFLRARMYRHYKVNRMASKARRLVADLFRLLTAEPECLPADWQAPEIRDDEAARARTVADYISGMTDRYAMLEHKRLFQLDEVG